MSRHLKGCHPPSLPPSGQRTLEGAPPFGSNALAPSHSRPRSSSTGLRRPSRSASNTRKASMAGPTRYKTKRVLLPEPKKGRDADLVRHVTTLVEGWPEWQEWPRVWAQSPRSVSSRRTRRCRTRRGGAGTARYGITRGN